MSSKRNSADHKKQRRSGETPSSRPVTARHRASVNDLFDDAVSQSSPQSPDARNDHATDELTTVARDPHRTSRLLRYVPLVLAAMLSVPLLWLAIAFSLEVSQIAVYIMQLGASGWAQFGVILMALGGFICVVAVLVCLFVGWRRDTWRWRWSWAGATVLAAGIMPLLGIVSAVFWW